MRIISQDGFVDIPYDSIIVFALNGNGVSACTVNDNYNKMTLGTYKNEDDALYVMECIRYSKMKGYDYFFMPSADSVPVWRQENRKVVSYDT